MIESSKFAKSERNHCKDISVSLFNVIRDVHVRFARKLQGICGVSLFGYWKVIDPVKTLESSYQKVQETDV